jgi:hypothetical protein
MGAAAIARALAPPRPKCARVQVHEIRLAVVSDAAAFQVQGAGGEIRAIDTGDADIDGASFDMQAVLSHSRALLVQMCVGLRGSIA